MSNCYHVIKEEKKGKQKHQRKGKLMQETNWNIKRKNDLRKVDINPMTTEIIRKNMKKEESKILKNPDEKESKNL